MLKYSVPRWYQELSIPQTKRVFALGRILECDHNEAVNERTHRCLREIGITSTFVKISSKKLNKMCKISKLDPAQFLCEVYRHVTGKYFEEEGYKKFYDCNERIILSAIALLKFSEIVMELHWRLPLGKPVKIPEKPKLLQSKPQKSSDSPYLEPLERPYDWRLYRKLLQKWRQKVKSIIKPLVILPSVNDGNHNANCLPKSYTRERIHEMQKHNRLKQKRFKVAKHDEKEVEKLDEVKQLELHSTDNDDDKYSHYESEMDFYISTYPKKSYPSGRKNLSMKWQSWLYDREFEFETLATEADCLLNSMREINHNIYNSNACHNCCACKQTRKLESKKQLTEVPHLILDSLHLDDDENKYVIGSMVLNSPTPSLPDSVLNLPQIIPSQEIILKKKIIDNVFIDDKGVARFLICGVTKDLKYTPQKKRQLPKPIKNVPSYNCKTDETEEINTKSKSEMSNEVDGFCVAEKYHSDEFIGCRKCTDEDSSNQIYRDFEKACRERENLKKQFELIIDHATCTQRLFHDEEVKETKSEPEKCIKCSDTLGKCQKNPFLEIINRINQEKLSDKLKVSKKYECKEYKDNIKLTVGGLTKDCNLLFGITLHTPKTITPVSSSESGISYSSSRSHHHWSVTTFKPKSKANEIERLTTLYSAYKYKRNLYEPFRERMNELYEKEEQFDLLQKRLKRQLMEIIEDMSCSLEHENEEDKEEREAIVIDCSVQFETTREKGGDDKNVTIVTTKSNSSNKLDKKEGKQNLPRLMKIALKDMAEEGFLLAKLPDCHKIPQLQAWIMFREGFIMTEKRKAETLKRIQALWDKSVFYDPHKIKAPSMKISRKNIEILTDSDFQRIEKELQLKKKKFYSKMRKFRVLEARAMWNLMNYQMFPNLAFKQAYFVYQASKESDGHFERPYGFSRRS